MSTWRWRSYTINQVWGADLSDGSHVESRRAWAAHSHPDRGLPGGWLRGGARWPVCRLSAGGRSWRLRVRPGGKNSDQLTVPTSRGSAAFPDTETLGLRLGLAQSSQSRVGEGRKEVEVPVPEAVG